MSPFGGVVFLVPLEGFNPKLLPFLESLKCSSTLIMIKPEKRVIEELQTITPVTLIALHLYFGGLFSYDGKRHLMKWKDTRAQLVPQHAKFKSSCARCLLCLIVTSKCARFARCFSVATKSYVLCNLLLYYIKWRTLFCLIDALMLRAHFGFSLIVAP